MRRLSWQLTTILQPQHDVVTYCFTVKNFGDTSLDATVSNPSFDYEKQIGVVGPGVSKALYVTSRVKGNSTNLATVEGVSLINWNLSRSHMAASFTRHLFWPTVL